MRSSRRWAVRAEQNHEQPDAKYPPSHARQDRSASRRSSTSQSSRRRGRQSGLISRARMGMIFPRGDEGSCERDRTRGYSRPGMRWLRLLL
jgi:hypothetical protein